MDQSRSIAGESPSSKASSPHSRTTGSSSRRGRPSRNDYVRLVIPLIRTDIWALNERTNFATYPGVRALVAQHQREMLPLGVALKRLLDRAVDDVISLGAVVTGHQMTRVVTFLRLWYEEEQPVTAVARHLQLERTHVVKTVQRPALELVARRFLALAEQVDPLQCNLANFEDLRRIIA